VGDGVVGVGAAVGDFVFETGVGDGVVEAVGNGVGTIVGIALLGRGYMQEPALSETSHSVSVSSFVPHAAEQHRCMSLAQLLHQCVLVEHLY
jgi:hypothetical protein